MRSPFAEGERDRLITAILPDVAFDGWSRPALRRAARRIGVPEAEALALFPRGAADLVAGFSQWADRAMLDRLAQQDSAGSGSTARIAGALVTRFDLLAPWREAVRRGLSVLAMPHNAALACRLLYDTVDGMWYAAGDTASDFSFYTKRATLAAIQAAATLYWLDDRSEDFADTRAFIDRRLADIGRLARSRSRLDAALTRLPNPLRPLRR